MTNFSIHRIDGLSAESSNSWFMSEEDIIRFMNEKYFRRVSERPELSFSPFRIGAHIAVEDEVNYELHLEFSDGETVMDYGKIIEHVFDGNVHRFRLSGRILESCEAICLA